MIIFRFNKVNVVVRGSTELTIAIALLATFNGQGLNEIIFMTEKIKNDATIDEIFKPSKALAEAKL